MSRRGFFVAVAGLVLAGVAGCSSSGATPPAGSSPSGPPADGGTYASADAILGALQSAGAPCVEPSPIANPTLTGALSMVDCGSSAGDSDTVVVVFDSQAHALAYAVSLTSGGLSGLSQGSVVVYGRDWAVNTKAGFAPLVQRVLGGQTVSGPSAAAS